MSSRGGGRDRYRRDFPSSRGGEEGTKRGSNPPSRNLWVGNLSHGLRESDLTDPFLRFGDLDSVAFQPGRSYAFVNFKIEEDAIDAMKALQGFPLAGNPLRIEFAKAMTRSTLIRVIMSVANLLVKQTMIQNAYSILAAGADVFSNLIQMTVELIISLKECKVIRMSKDKSSAPRNEDYLQRRDEQRSTLRGSPFSQRDSRGNASPDSFYTERSKMTDKSGEPSEVLWIGFPALLKVDETILRKAFSPFGEIEKITVFPPGRSYAFVRFRSLLSACRAKETLQGKLFGNPRVHICFAKSESGSSNSGRAPVSPHLKSNSRLGVSENFRRDRDFGGLKDPIRSHYSDPRDSDDYGFNRKDTLYPGESNKFDNWRFEEELGTPPDMYERMSSPIRERGAHFHEISETFSQKDSFYEEPWDLPEDYQSRGAKRLKTDFVPPDGELPEYPFTDLEQKRAKSTAFSDFSQPESFNRSLEARPLGYKSMPDHLMNVSRPRGERSDHWKASHDIFPTGSGSVSLNSIERKRFTPEPEQPSLKLWKWEGTIAKGGTLVCRARCFPVGKAMDMMLPEFLDCTARTGLDMLAKHYYQAASAWVVFFVPASDADIGYYNEFMHYLREKERAAVAKLDDKTTLFLVPPSDFSEKVLKVPGDMSISGVVLRLEHPGPNFGPPHHPDEKSNAYPFPFHGDASYPRPSTPPTRFASMTDSSKSGGDSLFLGNMSASASHTAFLGSGHPVVSDSYNENRHDYPLQQRNHMSVPNWSPPHSQNTLDNRNMPAQASTAALQDHPSVLTRTVQESSSSHYGSGISNKPSIGNSKLSLQETTPSVPLSMPISGLQPQQLAQLASSLLGQQKQSGSNSNISMVEDLRQTNTMNHTHGLQNNLVGSENLTSQLSQMQQLQQLQQASNVPISTPPQVQRDLQPGAQENGPQVQSSNTQQDADADPQKRLQATLQLAAALLQQIQQGKGT